MKKIFCTYLSYLVVTCFPSTMLLAASTSPLADKIEHAIQQLAVGEFKDLHLGMLVVDAKTGNVIYEHNADQYFMPASNQKLFTAFAAFSYLPTDFTFNTYLFADLAKVTQGQLNDPVYFKFTGDPTFDYAQLEKLMASLNTAGISQLNGDIIIDDSAFDNQAMSVGTSWDDSQYCFGAPLSPLILNENCALARITPGPKAGELASISLPDHPQSMRFDSNLQTVPANQAECDFLIKQTDNTHYAVSGCIPLDAPAKTLKMAVPDPRANMSYAILAILKQYNIRFTRQIQYRPIQQPVKLLSVVSSQPLPELIKKMLKESDNIIANAIFKSIGSYYNKQPGSWQNGQKAIHAIIAQHTTLALPKRSLFDGAGNSRYNFLTPRQIVTLLQTVPSKAFANNFINALPIAGVDGTLAERMQSASLKGNVYAKTGTESAVSTLAGYLLTQKQQQYIFAITINGFTQSPQQIKLLEDDICQILALD